MGPASIADRAHLLLVFASRLIPVSQFRHQWQLQRRSPTFAICIGENLCQIMLEQSQLS